jgi:hypothetical protein
MSHHAFAMSKVTDRSTRVFNFAINDYMIRKLIIYPSERKYVLAGSVCEYFRSGDIR